MNVPLSVVAQPIKNEQKLVIWADEKKHVVDAPFKPYCYSFAELDINSQVEEIEAVRLSDMKKTRFFKHKYNTVRGVEKNRIQGKTFEHNIPFIFRVRADLPDFYTQYPHKQDLKFLFFDIEQYSPPGAFFPTFDDRVTNIAYCTNKDRKIQKLSIKKTTKSDKGMLEYFRDIVDDIYPDVYVYYNKSYDLPTIIRRFERLNLDTRVFSKDNTKPYIGRKKDIKLSGSIIYDPYDNISGDQSLNGEVPDRGLKAVSNYFGYETDIEPIDFRLESIHDLIGTERLKDYNADDVGRLLYVFDIYFENVLLSAEDYKLPLSEVTKVQPFDLGVMLLGEEFSKRNIVSDGLNRDRFPEIFQREKEKDEANFQGALSNIKRYGTFKKVAKVDASSMYPRIVGHFNFSHDTTSIVGYEKYDKEGFKAVEKEDYYLYYIPDNVIKKTIIIKVLKKLGFTTKIMRERIESRTDYKEKYKKTKLKKYSALSEVEKVKANGIYGIQGNSGHPFGHLPIAMATTGIGREIIKLLILSLNELYPDCVIEWDTDGVYFTETDMFDEVEVWRRFDYYVEKKFGREIIVDVGYDYYDSGYFRKAKNYVLKKGDVIDLHGVSMKSSRMCPIERNLTKEMALSKLGEKDEYDVEKKYKNLTNFDVKDFVMSMEQGRTLKSYSSTGSLPYRLAVQAQHMLNQKPEVGNKYYYIKTIDGFELFQAPDRGAIDYNYYMNKVEDIIKRFQIESKNVKSLENFMGEEEEDASDWDFDQEDRVVIEEQVEEDKVVGLDNFF